MSLILVKNFRTFRIAKSDRGNKAKGNFISFQQRRSSSSVFSHRSMCRLVCFGI